MSILAGTVLAFALAEGTLRWAEYAPRSSGSVDGLKIFFTPGTLFQNDNTPSLGVDRYTGRATSKPFESDKKAEEQRPPPTDVIFLGDSITFGAGVVASDTFAWRVQSTIGAAVAVRNYGVVGYGPDQAVKLAQALNLATPTAIGILTLFVGNDFKDLASNKLVSCDSSKCKWSHKTILSPYISRFSIINLLRSGWLGKEAIPSAVVRELFNDHEQPFHALENEQRALSREQLRFTLLQFKNLFGPSRSFVLVVPPVGLYSRTINPRGTDDRATDYSAIDAGDFSEGQKAALEVCKEANVRAVDLTDSLNKGSYLPHDHHLNQSGHEKIATIAKDEINAIMGSISNVATF